MSLPCLAVAELCDGEQLPALLSGLENVRCDTAAAAEGQADKEWARERVWSEGRGCLQTLSSPLRGKGLRREPHNARSAVLPVPSCCIPRSCSLPCVAPCPSEFVCVSQLHGETCRVGALFPQGSQRPVHATSEGLLRASHRDTGPAWGTWRLHLGSLVDAGSWLCCCSSDPAQLQGQGPCPRVPVTTGRARVQGSAMYHPTSRHPGRAFAASCLFRCLMTQYGLQRAPSCLPVNLWGQV